jgi:hypothetical protein
MNPVHTSHPIYLRSILVLSSLLLLDLPSGLFHSGFSTKTLYAFSFSPMRATYPAHLILAYSNYIWRRVRVLMHHITQFSSAPYYFFPLKTKLRGLSPQANYTDRATAAVGELVPTFAGKGCYVVSPTDSQGR